MGRATAGKSSLLKVCSHVGRFSEVRKVGREKFWESSHLMIGIGKVGWLTPGVFRLRVEGGV